MTIWKVYLITNKINGKGYVGITSKPIETRLRNHVRDAYPGRKNPNGTLFALHAAFQKYGEESFSISELQIGLSLDEARSRETHYIEKLGTYGGGRFRRGYNQTMGGEIPDEVYGQDVVARSTFSSSRKTLKPLAVSNPSAPISSLKNNKTGSSISIAVFVAVLLALYFLTQ